jgi:ABC-type nitrate/sulfonate/bicarbonate transport system substrate-binding protein
MPGDRTNRILLALACALALAAGDAAAQSCSGPLRKINIGVAVSPPNVVHTTPYVAKALGYFAKRCVDANIIQFDGGNVGSIVAAIAQGDTVAQLSDIAIAQGLKAHQIWGLAPRPPQSYVVAEAIKLPSDLKGKRLSDAGGIGGFNWLMGREVLKKAGLTVDDVQFISQGTAGRLPGLVAGQVDAVVLHPEDVQLAEKSKPGAHVLITLADLVPLLAFNQYGASDAFIARDRDLLRDTMAAMIEANRTIYREPEKAVPAIVEATQKPKEAVEYAIAQETKACVWAINEGFDRARTEGTHANYIELGDIPREKRMTFEQIVDMKLASDAVAAAGGPVTIGSCKD